MFEDSLMESAGRIRTRGPWTAAGSLLMQGTILVLLLPEIYPETLPKLSRLFIARPLPTRAAVPRLTDPFAATTIIAQHRALGVHDASAPTLGIAALDSGSRPGLPAGLNDIIGRTAERPVVGPVVPKRPVRISSGVASGQLLSPIHAVYPAIASRLESKGRVVVEATINRQGNIENL